MSQSVSPFQNGSDLSFKAGPNDTIVMSYGALQVSLSVDSAYDMQYMLAAFLAKLELQEYPREQEEEATGIFEGRQTLESLACFPNMKWASFKIDS